MGIKSSHQHKMLYLVLWLYGSVLKFSCNETGRASHAANSRTKISITTHDNAMMQTECLAPVWEDKIICKMFSST
ncbi:hypothetical protein M758_4G139300 [Ceratodon purpureus]|nr:hypothetical protein M758_4G139300 [Ceratodon purpureus]